jgi:O-antigen ligase
VTGLIVLMLSCMFLISVVENGNRAFALNDSWERAILWESAISANATPFFGVGTGDYKIALNDYYTKHNLEQFASESYNAHNQLIQLLFSNGVFGLLAFSIMIGRPLYLAVKKKNILAILCIFPFLIYGMTEVFLGRYQGIVFFALLHQIFINERNSETTTTMPQLIQKT